MNIQKVIANIQAHIFNEQFVGAVCQEYDAAVKDGRYTDAGADYAEAVRTLAERG